jgi:type IX secretion system PorP/SprF family membrane protein
MKEIKNIVKLKLTWPLLLVLMLLGNLVRAQQDPLYTQYMNNLMSFNPAYTAVRGVASFSGLFRDQWINLDGSPKSTSLSFSMPLDSLNMGLGVDFHYDITANHVQTSELYFNYSYRIKVGGKSTLSFGLKAGVNFIDSRLTPLYRHDYDDEYILKYGDYTKWMFNTGVGIFWYNEKFYAGISVPRLIENYYHKDVTSVQALSREKQHYFLHGAYMIDLSDKVAFKPGLTTIMTAGAPITADFDFSFMFYQKVWFGLIYRISDAVGAYTQFQYKNMKIGLSYDYTYTRLREFENGTFEIMLRYDFKTNQSQTFPFPTF